MQALLLSPEKCIAVVRKDNSQKDEGKADALDLAEGSRPVCVMASVQVTTGVLDQGMCSKWVPRELHAHGTHCNGSSLHLSA